MAETITTFDNRLWWPEAFIDEGMPGGRSSPDAWLCIVGQDPGAHAIEGDEGLSVAPIMLREGQEVRFSAQDDLGTSLLRFDENAEPSWSPEPPSSCNFVWDGDVDGLEAQGPEEFVQCARDYGYADPESWMRVHLLHVADQFVTCRFTALDGLPRFVPLQADPPEPDAAVEAPADADAEAARG